MVYTKIIKSTPKRGFGVDLIKMASVAMEHTPNDGTYGLCIMDKSNVLR